MTDTLAIAFRLARRELRSGLQGFRIFLACLILGVGAIAIVGSLSAALERGIANEGRTLMGGDIEFSVLHSEPTPDQRQFIRRMQAGSAGWPPCAPWRLCRTRRLPLSRSKVVDDAYPLYGKLELSPDVALTSALQPDAQGIPGTVVEQSLLDRLGLKPVTRYGAGTQSFASTQPLYVSPTASLMALCWARA
jgi:putative ABC transport system permease protein